MVHSIENGTELLNPIIEFKEMTVWEKFFIRKNEAYHYVKTLFSSENISDIKYAKNTQFPPF